MQSTTDSLDFVTIEGLPAAPAPPNDRAAVTDTYDHNGICEAVL